MKKLGLVVSTKCQLFCEHCSQDDMMAEHVDWDLGWGELSDIIMVLKERDVVYDEIHLMGGEPTLWEDFNDKCRELMRSGMCRSLSMSTNGLSWGMVDEDVLDCFKLITISVKGELEEERVADNVIKHGTHHKPLPMECVEPDIEKVICGCDYVTIFKDRVYRCGNALSLMLRHYGSVDDWDYRRGDVFEELFNSDSLKKFVGDKRFEMCGWCLSNKYVWDKVGFEIES